MSALFNMATLLNKTSLFNIASRIKMATLLNMASVLKILFDSIAIESQLQRIRTFSRDVTKTKQLRKKFICQLRLLLIGNSSTTIATELIVAVLLLPQEYSTCALGSASSCVWR